MATIAREILNAVSMDLRISCAGQSYVGINVAGTFVGTITFEASQAEFGDTGPGGGANWKSTSVFAQPSAPIPGNVVNSTTTTGSWFWPVQAYATFRARVSAYTSGSPVVTLAASMDSSWGDAFLTPGSKFLNSYTNGLKNVLTIPANANLGRRLRSLVVTAVPHTGGGGAGFANSSSIAGPASAVWASNPVLKIYDGTEATGTLLYGYDLPSLLPVERNIPLPAPQTTQYGVSDGGIYFTPGSVGTIVVASGGANVSVNVNAELATA